MRRVSSGRFFMGAATSVETRVLIFEAVVMLILLYRVDVEFSRNQPAMLCFHNFTRILVHLYTGAEPDIFICGGHWRGQFCNKGSCQWSV